MRVPQPYMERSAVIIVSATLKTRLVADVAFGTPTDVAGVPAPVHRY